MELGWLLRFFDGGYLIMVFGNNKAIWGNATSSIKQITMAAQNGRIPI